jgi:uncharacterized protein YbaP (TraB family)
MKKILAVAIMLFGLGASAQNANALLWKISGSGLKAPSYLYGTIHITCDATLPKNTLDALDKTAQLYLELDMDDPAMQAALMGGMMMSDGKTMSSMTSPEDFKNTRRVHAGEDRRFGVNGQHDEAVHDQLDVFAFGDRLSDAIGRNRTDENHKRPT